MTETEYVWEKIPLDDPRVTWKRPRDVMNDFLSGDEKPWCDELAFLWSVDGNKMYDRLLDIHARGIIDPIRVLQEGFGTVSPRVIDGHHRIAAALALDIPVPVVYVKWDNEVR